MQSYQLEIKQDDGELHVITLSLQHAVLGCDDSADVRLPHASVSPIHCKIVCRDNSFYLIDQNSSTGTWLDSEPLVAHQVYPLPKSCVITVGEHFTITYTLVNSDHVDETLHTKEIAHRLVCELLQKSNQSDSRPYLLGIQGVAQGKKYKLNNLRYVFGRDEQADVLLLDNDISRRHFEIRIEEQYIEIADLFSKNGTTVNNEPLPENRFISIVHGAIIAAGQCSFRLCEPVKDYLNQLNKINMEANHSSDTKLSQSISASDHHKDPSTSVSEQPMNQVTTETSSIVSVILVVLIVLALTGILYITFA